MGLSVAVQMDPVAGIDIAADSTFRLAIEAQARGHRLFHYLPDHLSWSDGRLVTRAAPVTFARSEERPAELGAAEIVNLDAFDVVLLRQDPPFDMGYVTNTHLLELAPASTLVMNNPFWVRNAPEKIFVTRFRQFMPPTLITRDLDALKAFRADHGDIIVKPLYGNGGAGVFRLRPDDGNLASLYEMFTETRREPFMAQRFLPEVSAGDKRVILIDGEPIGAINRVPQPGETRSNLHVGGVAKPTDLTARDEEICAALGPELRERGLVFVGIDVIGDTLTEINVTSPTGLQELERFSGINGAALFWDAVEGRHATLG